MNYLLYIIFFIIFILFIVNILLYLYNKIINNIEKKINILFDEKLWIIPGLFEISDNFITKHSNVFEESLKIFKLDSTICDPSIAFTNRYYIISLLDKEFDFLFKIFNKNKKIIRNYKFLYLKDIIINNNISIWRELDIYNNTIKKYNILIKWNNLFLIWYLLPNNYIKI